LGGRISIHLFQKQRERRCSKNACRLLSESKTRIDEPMYLVRSLLRCTPVRPIVKPGHGSRGSIGGLTPCCWNWWADAPLLILVGWRSIANIGRSTCLCGKTMFEMIHWWYWYMYVICIVDKYMRFWKVQAANVPENFKISLSL